MLVKIKVDGREFNKEQVFECFTNIITRLPTDQFKRARQDISVVEKSLKNMR